MAGPTFMEMPSYIIYRDTQPGTSAHVASPLVFLPPLGSDELFDALRLKYPHIKTHSERVGQATMEFFLEEDLTQLPTPQGTATSSNVSPWEAALPSFSSEASTWSSPDAFEPATPSLSPQGYPLSRQPSTVASFAASGPTSPPAIEAMTSVFSLASSSQPKQRVRRKMTESEKIEYRKRRMAKACDKCAKRKRKCTHNESQVEALSNKSKSTKASLNSRLPKIQESESKGRIPAVVDVMDSVTTTAMPSFDNFDLEIPPMSQSENLEDFAFDDFLTSQPQWPWSESADWTLLDPVADANVANHQPSLESTSMEATWFGDLDASFMSVQSSQAYANGSGHGDTAQQFQQPFSTPSGSSQPQHAVHVRGSFVNPSCLAQTGGRQGVLGSCQDGIFHEPDERHQPPHPQSREATPSSNAIEPHGLIDVETAADGRANQRSPSLADSRSTADASMKDYGTVDSATQNATSENAIGGLQISESKSQPRMRRVDDSRRSKRRCAGNIPNGSLEIGTDLMGQHLLLDSQSNEQGDPSGPDQRDRWSATGLGLRHAAGNSKGMLQQRDSQTKYATSLGTGITSTVSPRSQLYMLKKRLPRTADTATAGAMLRLEAPTSLLQTIPQAPIMGEGTWREICCERVELISADAAGIANVNGLAMGTMEPAGVLVEPSAHCVSSSAVVFSDRLSDHVRHRDHFGRVFSFAFGGVLQAGWVLAALGCLLVLLACLPSHVHGVTPSMLMLALIVSVKDGVSDNAPARRSADFVKGLRPARSVGKGLLSRWTSALRSATNFRDD